MSGRSQCKRARRLAGKAKRVPDDSDDPLDIAVKSETGSPNEESPIFGFVDSQELVEEQQRLQGVYNMNMSATDKQDIYERLASFERKVDFLLNVSTKILARVDRIWETMHTVTPLNEFPIKDKEELEAIDIKIANSREKYIELFKNMLRPNGIVKNIGRIFDKSLLMDMNYGGLSSKTGLSNYINLNAALFESQKTEGYTFDDYKKSVRLAFQKAKNKVYKAVSEARRLKKLKNVDDEIKNEDTDVNESNEMI